MFSKEAILTYLRIHYPHSENKVLCQHLGLSSSALRTLASRNGIKKSSKHLKDQHAKLMAAKEAKYLASIPDITLSKLEKNIIVGSILGDGSLTFAPRSRNAYYREHFSVEQKQYREWKCQNIKSINLRIEKEQHLKSPSHPIFTELYNVFYPQGKKIITEENIKLLDHPIGLACLFLDDGTLSISVQKKNNTIYITPSVSLTTLCFSQDECKILASHILKRFGINFSLGYHPSGNKNILRISRLDEVDAFYTLITPYCKEITALQYKWDYRHRLRQKKNELEDLYASIYKIRISTREDLAPHYTQGDVELILHLKNGGESDKFIAQALGRSYWGIVDKIRRLRKEGLFLDT